MEAISERRKAKEGPSHLGGRASPEWDLGDWGEVLALRLMNGYSLEQFPPN